MKLGRNEKRQIRQLYKMGEEKRTEELKRQLTNYYADLDCSFLGGSFYRDELLEYEAKIFNVKPDFDEIDRIVTNACI